MAGRIPAQFIDDLLYRTDIVSIISQRIPLKKAGRDYQACCPFHEEKTPSFTVSSQKQFYHCFGCGAHGTAIGFLMDYDNLDFVEAVEALAQQAGVEVPREAGMEQQGPDLKPLYALLERASNHFQQQLRQHPQANLAIDYLKNRGLSGAVAARFGIGYAPPGWDHLVKALGRTGLEIGLLRESGLITDQEDKKYDRFRNRIIFPIRDQRGRIIGFGGRVINKEDSPKYLNSPETPVFHKGRELYGLYEARQALRKIERLLVVEGYMDVVALAQNGIANAVATLGTATTKEHLELIFRTCKEVCFCFDGDRAGRDAAWKALQTALPLMRAERKAGFLFLPEGEDPDTLVRKEGAAAFQERVRHALPLSEFMLNHLKAQVDMNTLDGRAQLLELAKPLLELLPKGIFRQMLAQHLEQQAGAQVGLSKTGAVTPAQVKKQSGLSYGKARSSSVRQAISLLLDSPGIAQHANEIADDWRRWDAPGISLLAQLIDEINATPNINTARLMERWRDRPEYPHLDKLAQGLSDIPDLKPDVEFADALKKLNEQYHKNNLSLAENLKPSEMSHQSLALLKQRYPGKSKPTKD